MPSTPFKLIIDIALTDYAKGVGIDPARHPFADILQNCRSPEDVLGLLESKADDFKDYRDGNRKLIDHLKPVVDVVHALSGILGEAFPGPLQPAKAIFVGVDVLITAAKGVSSAYDALVDLFECIGNFLKRLRIYTDTPLTPFVMNIVAKIMAELLSVLALATKHINQGRFSTSGVDPLLGEYAIAQHDTEKFAKKLLGDRDIETVLRKLDHLTQEEGRRTMAQTLEVVYRLVNNVKVVMDGTWQGIIGRDLGGFG
ncbi:hypothetical protein EDB86DRAFT_2831087 [Lactarius hatsudake]|nr:hypothetical protein EDB86DRAFT_2831087 [Lactarius hatsudake]